MYASEPTAVSTAKHQYVVFLAPDEVNNASNVSTAGGAYFTQNDQILYTSTGRLYTGSGTPYVRTSNNNYVRYTGENIEGEDIYKYNRVQLTDIDGSQKYYMVRDGYSAEINQGARHSLAANERLIDVVWTGNGTPPSDLLTNVASTNSFTGTQTNLGKELEQVHATMYAGASNSAGTEVNSTWNYIITEDDGHKDLIQGSANGSLPGQFMTTSTTDTKLTWDDNLQSYKFDGQIVPQQNVYVIGNNIGVFTKQDGSLYTGDVYGKNNELLRTTVQDGQYYSYWAADVTDPALTMKDYPVVEYNEDLKALENNDEKLAQNDIHHIKVAKTSTDGAANTTASIAAYRNGDDMQGTENDTNLVSGQVNLKESGGTGGIANNGANDRKMSVSVTNRVVTTTQNADGTSTTSVTTQESPVADFSLGSRVGDTSDLTSDKNNLKKLTINGQSYGLKTYFKGNNVDEATVEANLGDTVYVQGSDTNAADTTGNNNIVVTAGDTTAGKRLSIALNEHVKISKLTTGNTEVDTNGVTITNTTDDSKNVTLTGSGLNNGNNTITNVAAGENATDAVNVSQLKDVEATANKGWNAKVNDSEQTINVTPTSNTLTFADGDNIALTQDTASSSIKVGTTAKAGFDELHVDTGVGRGSSAKDGITLGNQETTKTDNTTTETGLYITGLENKTWTAGNIVDGRAATENQLQALQEQINQTHTIATAAGDSYISEGNVHDNDNGTYEIRTTKATVTKDADGKEGNPSYTTGPTIEGLHDYYVTSGSVSEDGKLTLTRQNGTVDIDLSSILGSNSDWHVKDGDYSVQDNGDVELTLQNGEDSTETKKVTIKGLQSKANANLSFDADSNTEHENKANTVAMGGTQKILGNSVNENIRTKVDNSGNIVVSLGQDVKVNTLTAGSLDGSDGLRHENGKIRIVGDAKEGNKEYINVTAGYRENEKPADPAKADGDSDGITRLTYQGDKLADSGDVLGQPHVVATLEDGYRLSGDVTRDVDGAATTSVGLGLNKEISLKGGATTNLVDSNTYKNIGVTVKKDKETGMGDITFQLSKDLDGLNTVTTRTSTGVQGATLGNQNVTSTTNKSESGSYVTKLGNTKWYTNATTGVGGSIAEDNSIVSGRAATEDQLQAVQAELTQDIDRIDGKETNLSVENNKKPTANDGNYVGKNLQLKYNTEKDGHIQNYDLKLADDLDVTSVTTGNTKMNTEGITITDTENSDNNVTLSVDGLNNGNKKVTNVAAGDVNATSTDAINGSQLYTVQQNVNSGWTAAVKDNTSTIGITPTNKTLTFEAGDNIALTPDAATSTIKVATTEKAGFTELHVAGSGTGSNMTDGITLGTQSNLERDFNQSYTETKFDVDESGNQTGGYTVITYTKQAGNEGDTNVTYKGSAQHYTINGVKDDNLPDDYKTVADVTVEKKEETSGKYITGLDNTKWNEHSFVSGRAATEDQLNQVAEQVRGQVSAADQYVTGGGVKTDSEKDGKYDLALTTSQNGDVAVQGLHDYYVTSGSIDTTNKKLTLNQQSDKTVTVDMSPLQLSFDADTNAEHGSKANTPDLGGTQKILGDSKNIHTKVDASGNIVVGLDADPSVTSITIGDTKITNEGDHLTYVTKEGDTEVTNTIATLGDGYKLAGDVTRSGVNAVTDPVSIDLGKAISLQGGASNLVDDAYKNVGVTVTKNDDGSADVNFQLNKDLDGLNSVTMRDSRGGTGAVLGYHEAVFQDGQKETGSYLTGLENKTWDPRKIVSGRAATEDQLQKVQDVIADSETTITNTLNAKRTAVTVNGGTAAPADASYSTGGNLQLKKTTDADTGKDTYDVKLADDINVNSVTTGNTTINNEGVTINNKKYITDEGINANEQKIINVSDGDVKEGSKDAVNGGQLYNVEQKVDQNTQNINNIQTDVTNVKKLAGKVTSLDGTIKVTEKDENTDQHSYDLSVDYDGIADHVADNVKLSYKANDGEKQQVTLNDGLNFKDGNGTKASVDKDGVVKYDLADDINVNNITIGQPGKDGKDGQDGSIGLVGKDGKDGTTTTIIKTIGKNGTDGTNGTPGVDGKDGITRIVYQDGQDGEDGKTHTVATLDDGLKFAGDTGDGAAVKLNNQVSLTGGAKGTLTDGNIGVDASQDGDNAKLTIKLAKDIKGMSSTTYTTEEGTTVIHGGGVTIGGNQTYNNITIRQGNVDVGGNQIHNVAPGTAPGDAVNVGQLNESMTNVGHSLSKMNNRIDRVGAGAAALAGLHPQDFDPEDKWDFAAGYGHYRSANAMAVGAFYRPDEYTMVNVGGSFGGGENLINAGLTIKLGKRDKDGLRVSRVAMAQQIRDLKATISMQEAKIQESDAREAEQNQRIAQLEAMVKTLVAKQG